MTKTNCFIGIDVGTSGLRGSVINENGDEILYERLALSPPEQNGNRCEGDPQEWLTKLHQLLQTLMQKLDTKPDTKLDKQYHCCAIAIDGTSSTLIACDEHGEPLAKALMYNDSQSTEAAEIISNMTPDDAIHQSGAQGASSSLAKALTLLERYPQTKHFCHQADWLAASLTGQYDISDENNCLKLGYDIIDRQWPQWLFSSGLKKSQLPKVLAPGSFISTIRVDVAKKLGLNKDCQIIAGTTDSIAAVIATGANQTGDAVTSLGSTLVIKLLSERPVFDASAGIYSHRLGKRWLVGGASNSGGRVLQQHFSQQQLDEMTGHLQPKINTGFNYYPLPATGERFPVNDCHKQAELSPRPEDDRLFFQAILEGISNIEHLGYQKLLELGASKTKRIFTCGGGNNNPAWRKIREQTMGIAIVSAAHTEASYGSALLAKQGWQQD